MLYFPGKIISLILTFALVFNPVLGLASPVAADSDVTDDKSLVSIQGIFSQAENTENFNLSYSDCCCYQDYVGICGGAFDCQHCCSAMLIQAPGFVLSNNGYMYSRASNNGSDSLEFPPILPPPLTIRY